MADYAPEYTKKERLKIVLMHLACTIPVILIAKLWFLPWFNEYADNAHCYDYDYFTGTQVVLYSIFIGIPISFALLIFAIEGTRSLRVIRLGQNPLPGEKVFRPTKYSYGFRARVKPVAVLLLIAGMTGVGVKGIFTVDKVLIDSDYSHDQCVEL